MNMNLLTKNSQKTKPKSTKDDDEEGEMTSLSFSFISSHLRIYIKHIYILSCAIIFSC